MQSLSVREQQKKRSATEERIINDEDVSSAPANGVRRCLDHELMSERRSKHKFEMQVREIIAPLPLLSRSPLPPLPIYKSDQTVKLPKERPTAGLVMQLSQGGLEQRSYCLSD